MMKKIVILLLPFLFLVSCGKTLLDNRIQGAGNMSNMTKTEFSSPLDTTFFVSEEDILAYIKYKILLEKNKGRDLSVEEIRPVGPNSEETLCYLINYNDGWDIVSADRRTPVVLAQQDSGQLDLSKCESDEAVCDVVSWIGFLASEVLSVRSSPIFIPEDAIAEAGVESSLSFWTNITHPEEILGIPVIPTKAHNYPGHWELVDTIEEIIDYDVIDLCGTSWHQGQPYNTYAPLKTDGSGEHAPAGCVAVAGAQMLNCLYSQYGLPQTIPTSASVTGNINNYLFTYSGFSSSGWTAITNQNTNQIAILIAFVGYYIGNNWGNDGTGATLTGLQSNIFSAFGYQSTLGPYQAIAAINSLVDSQLPVVMSAWDGVFYVLGIPILWRAAGHAFLIDRYKRQQVKTTYYYEWIYDYLPENEMIEQIGPRTETIYGNPFVSSYIGMNWGWGAYYNNTWYSASGSWNIADYDFDDERQMISNFSVTTP